MKGERLTRPIEFIELMPLHRSPTVYKLDTELVPSSGTDNTVGSQTLLLLEVHGRDDRVVTTNTINLKIVPKLVQRRLILLNDVVLGNRLGLARTVEPPVKISVGCPTGIPSTTRAPPG